MEHRERAYHAPGVYLTQDPSRMETARLEQEKETDTKTVSKSGKKSGRKERGYDEKSQSRPSLLALRP